MACRTFALTLAALTALCLGAPPARAEPGARPVLLLISETIAKSEGPADARFWWSDFEEPSWTETDRALHAELAPRGVRPAPIERPISAIYRRADLAPQNVRALARLIGADAAYSGSIEFERVSERGPFGTQGWLATARIGSPEAAGWEIAHARFGADEREIVASLRAELSEAIARRIAADLAARPAQGALLPGAGDDLIVAGAWRGADLDRIARALGELDPPLEARVRWTSSQQAGLRVGRGAEDARRAASALALRGAELVGRPIIDRSDRAGALVRVGEGVERGGTD